MSRRRVSAALAAVLDFGFFTTAGDPAFEAAVTAAIWDMYGPHAEHHTAALARLLAAELGYPGQTLALYQAAYALTTYDLFSRTAATATSTGAPPCSGETPSSADRPFRRTALASRRTFVRSSSPPPAWKTIRP